MARPTFATLLAAFACLATCAASAETALNAKTSWIGNTFGYGDGTWTQINITAIAVAPDGRVYTNAPWDESGAEASTWQSGKMLGFAGGTHGWGTGGGNAIALNHRYVFIAVSVGNEKGHLVGQGIWPQKGKQWFGISRRQIANPKLSALFQPPAGVANMGQGASQNASQNAGQSADANAGKSMTNSANHNAAADPHAQLAAGFLMMNEVPAGTRADIDGLAASDTTLYAANTTQNRIEVYDAESMQKKAAWSVHEPGKMALASDGTLWVLTGTLTDKTPRVTHYSARGQLLADTLPLPADAVPVDIARDPQGRLLIADNGPRQQVLFFSKHNGGYVASGTLGERGGIFSGVAGQPGPQRFNGLTGVGADARGNIYVATNGIGPHYAPLGAGLGATLESYAPDGKRQWQVQGLLFVDGAWMDPARPNSVYTGNKRFELDLSKPAGQEWRYAGFLSNRFIYPDDPVFHTDQWPGLPIARQLNGHTFLYLTDMYADHLKIYRFDAAHDGETAIPSGFIAGRERPVALVPNAPPGGDWIWRDVKGDGRFDSDEFTVNTSGAKLAGGWGWWVDSAGDIWRTSDTKGIRRLHFDGLDAKGNPIYAYTDMTSYPVPQPFTELRRAIYVPETDSLYVSGYTPETPVEGGFWKEVGRVLVRYDHWSSGKPVQRYAITLPWQTHAKPIETIIGLTVEGQYVFAVEPVGAVHVYDKDSGKEVGVIRPGPEVGNTSGWVDVPNGISAYRRSDGEYLVFVEEDARGKVMMYRWKPA